METMVNMEFTNSNVIFPVTPSPKYSSVLLLLFFHSHVCHKKTGTICIKSGA